MSKLKAVFCALFSFGSHEEKRFCHCPALRERKVLLEALEAAEAYMRACFSLRADVEQWEKDVLKGITAAIDKEGAR